MNLLTEMTAAHLWLNDIYSKPATCSKGRKVPFAVTGHKYTIFIPFSITHPESFCKSYTTYYP